MLQNIEPVVGFVEEESAGEAAGVLAGDRIVGIDGEATESWEDVQFALMTSPQRSVLLSIERGESSFDIDVVPRMVEKYEFGDAGLYPRYLPRVTQVFRRQPS